MSFTKQLASILIVTTLSGCALLDTLSKPAPEEKPARGSVTIELDSSEQAASESAETESETTNEQATATTATEPGDAGSDTSPKPTLAEPKIKNQAHAQQAKQASSAYQRAVSELRNDNLKTAYAAFEKLHQEYPLLAGPLTNMAIILRRQGDLQQAYDLLNQAQQAHSENPYFMNELGLISRKLGKFDQAKESYETAIKVDFNYAKAHYNLGVLADLYLHNPNLALQEFEAYQSLQPEPDNQVKGWILELQRRAGKP